MVLIRSKNSLFDCLEGKVIEYKNGCSYPYCVLFNQPVKIYGMTFIMSYFMDSEIYPLYT
jgi:hypothetical protein